MPGFKSQLYPVIAEHVSSFIKLGSSTLLLGVKDWDNLQKVLRIVKCLHTEPSECWLIRREAEIQEAQCVHASVPICAGKPVTELKAKACFSHFLSFLLYWPLQASRWCNSVWLAVSLRPWNNRIEGPRSNWEKKWFCKNGWRKKRNYISSFPSLSHVLFIYLLFF